MKLETICWTLATAIFAIACGREVPKSNLPAPEYERPSMVPWTGLSDAGSQAPVENTPDASSSVATEVGIE
jgi:hypothetical protein